MTWFGVPPGPLACAFIVAALVTALELVTSKYPRTAQFCVRSPWFYIYVVIYGVLGAAALALLPLVGSQVTMEGIGIGNPWIKATFVGLSIKALLHIRVFSVSTGPGQSFPFGLESFVLLFEPWMLRSIELNHFAEESDFIKPRAVRFPNVADARTQAKANPPPGFSTAETAVFQADIDQAATSAQVISAYLKYVGTRLTTTTFP